jgi:hypothetical protein
MDESGESDCKKKGIDMKIVRTVFVGLQADTSSDEEDQSLLTNIFKFKRIGS